MLRRRFRRPCVALAPMVCACALPSASTACCCVAASALIRATSAAPFARSSAADLLRARRSCACRPNRPSPPESRRASAAHRPLTRRVDAALLSIAPRACSATRLLFGERIGQRELTERIAECAARQQREPLRQALDVALRFCEQLERIGDAELDDRVDQQFVLVRRREAVVVGSSSAECGYRPA